MALCKSNLHTTYKLAYKSSSELNFQEGIADQTNALLAYMLDVVACTNQSGAQCMRAEICDRFSPRDACLSVCLSVFDV